MGESQITALWEVILPLAGFKVPLPRDFISFLQLVGLGSSWQAAETQRAGNRTKTDEGFEQD